MAHVDVARPLETLADWLHDARDAELPEHDAATLATTSATGRPTARTISVRRVQADGVVFTTALRTRKARDLRLITMSM